MFLQLKYYRNALIWAFLILLLCSMPVKGIATFKLINILDFDKLAHMLLFGIQFWFLAIGQSKKYVFSYKRMRVGRVAFIITLLYGAGIELMQGYLLSGRTMDIMDMLANTIGALIGWLLFYIFKQRGEKNYR
jgi:glycopeptide antibiotics resistance protein